MENNTLDKCSQGADSQLHQGVGPWSTGMCQQMPGRFQNLRGQVTAKCPPFFPFQMILSTVIIIFLSLNVATYLFSANGTREAAPKKSLPDMIIQQEILGFEPGVVTR